MRRLVRQSLAVAVVVGCLAPAPALAQVAFDVVGVRALGMAGAFTAVADDATAVALNPAGLITGPMAGVTIEWDQFQFRKPSGPAAGGGWRQSGHLTALGAWPIGISYGRFTGAGMWPRGGSLGEARSLVIHQVGGTVLQSVSERVVVGATVKYLRGSHAFSSNQAGTLEQALDAAGSQTGHVSHHLDADLGLMADFGRVRLGGTWRNLRRPEFTDRAGTAIHLARRASLGLAVFPVDGLTLALDVDLDTADPLVGLRRLIALGGEARPGSGLALRGGVRWLRGSGNHPIGSIGASLRLRRGFWLDGYFTGSRSAQHRGVGVALRAAS